MVMTEPKIIPLERVSPAQYEAVVHMAPMVLSAARRRGSYYPDEILVGSLGDARLRIQSPIKVKFTAENQDFIAAAVEFDEYGFGDSRSSALRDLQRAIVELYYALESRKDVLGTDLQGVWSRLQDKIKIQEP